MQAGRSTVVLALLCCFHQALAGGTLSFLTLYSPLTVSSGDYGGPVSTGGAFEFGDGYVYNVYVSTNGYFSMGESPRYSSPGNFPGSSSYSVVAPFGADMDTSWTGSVKYTQFTTSDSSQMNTVSSFIRSETGNSFYGARMMVAEWRGFPEYFGSIFSTNTFQGILITDGSSSYAVFIYECGGMEWGGGVIGWQEDLTDYNSHYLSGESNSNDIGCLYSTNYSAVVFKIDDVSCYSSQFRCYSGECVSDTRQCTGIDSCSDGSDEEGCTPTTSPCYYYEFTCDNGNCEPDSYRCDGYDDCGDNSDEVGCGGYYGSYGSDGSDGSGSSTGLAVGLTVVLLILLFFIGIPICVGVIICYKTNRRSQHSLRTRVVATTPATGATVVTPIQTTSMNNPSLYVQPQCPQQPQPSVLYTQPQKPYPQYPQQPAYKDPQLSSQEAPPSYDAVTAAANPTQQIPLAYPGSPPAGPPPNQAYPVSPPAGPPPKQAYPGSPPAGPPPNRGQAYPPTHDGTGNVN